jgi:hypothetical protein
LSSFQSEDGIEYLLEQVVVMEVKGLKSLPTNKIVYCTMEVDGGDKLQTDQAEASKPWYASYILYSNVVQLACHSY